MEQETTYLHEQLRNIIKTICNEIGCEKCDSKWEGGCIATDIQDRIYDMELQKENQELLHVKE